MPGRNSLVKALPGTVRIGRAGTTPTTQSGGSLRGDSWNIIMGAAERIASTGYRRLLTYGAQPWQIITFLQAQGSQ